MTAKYKRIRVVASALRTMDDVRDTVRQTVALQLRREQLIAERDKALQVIAERFGAQIDEAGATIEERTALLQQWAEAHEDAFGRDRSMSIEGHRLGWRLGNHRAATRRKSTWADVLERIRACAAQIQQRFLRVKEEINKEALIAARETDPDLLAAIGVEIVQTEAFYLEPNREGQPDVRIAGEKREVAS
jgi:phage host-nuclease inhibitor protein Gam